MADCEIWKRLSEAVDKTILALSEIQEQRDAAVDLDPHTHQFAALVAVARESERCAVRAPDQHLNQHGCGSAEAEV